MKKKFLTVLFIAVLIGIAYYTSKIIHKEESKELLIIAEKPSCNNEKLLYYSDANGYDYYTSCIEKITNKNNVELKELLANNEIKYNEIIENIIDNSKKEKVLYNDGGSILFEFDSYSILSCYKKHERPNYITYNNMDIIIGNEKLDIDNGYCDLENNQVGSIMLDDFYPEDLSSFDPNITLGKMEDVDIVVSKVEEIWKEKYPKFYEAFPDSATVVSFDKTKDCWHLYASLSNDWLGRTPEMIVRRADGKILADWYL